MENFQEIQKYQLKLKRLNTEITLVEENEKRRIAENLHDSLGQTLSLAFMTLSSINKESSKEKIIDTIQTSSELLDKAISESRTLTYDLSPPILYELGLVPAIKWRLDQYKEKTNSLVNLSDSSGNILLSKAYNIFLYRAVGELLTNIQKHAKCTLVDIKLSTNDNKFKIIIKDNGVGFSKNKVLETPSNIGGFGLISIEERIQNLNGIFKIESKLGVGTKATIIIPLNEMLFKE
jgi:two-component system sensor histidine kinase/response regulator